MVNSNTKAFSVRITDGGKKEIKEQNPISNPLHETWEDKASQQDCILEMLNCFAPHFKENLFIIIITVNSFPNSHNMQYFSKPFLKENLHHSISDRITFL